MQPAPNTKLVTEALRELLVGTGLAGFSFATCFALRFERAATHGVLPFSMLLELDCTWWFGDQHAWISTVNSLGPRDLPDPEEAVLAYELVRLRWATNSRVKEVEFDGRQLQLGFGGDRVIHVVAMEPDESWKLTDEARGAEPEWVIALENQELFAHSPSRV